MSGSLSLMERPISARPNTRIDASQWSDEQLVLLALSDPTFFEPLMRRHNQRLFRITRAMLGNDSEAEDAMQQAYVSAFAGLAGFDHTGSFEAWLVRIARNESLSRLRRRKRWHEVDLDLGVEGELASGRTHDSPSPESALDARALARRAEHAIDELPESYRAVFVLRELHGLDTHETATELAISEENVKVRLHRARQRLRAMLGGDVASDETFVFLGERCDRVVAAVIGRITSPSRA